MKRALALTLLALASAACTPHICIGTAIEAHSAESVHVLPGEKPTVIVAAPVSVPFRQTRCTDNVGQHKCDLRLRHR